MENPPRPVTGYPVTGYPPPQSAANPRPNGYPYNAAPPYYNPNPYIYANPRATFLRRFIAIMIGLFIITGTIVFIVWLVLRPRIPQVTVDSVSVTNFTTSSSQVTGNWDVRFSVRNPNKKMSIYYDSIVSSLFYEAAFLSRTTLPPFDQDTRNLTTVRAEFAAAGVYVDGRLVNEINSERARGAVGFDVTVQARVRFSAGAWKARRRFLRVLCEDVAVGLSSNGASGTLVGGPKECRVGPVSKFWVFSAVT
ncbi:hypothetical protein L1049_013715 [Liquidambar formosana]|uniref:Late embryogenesis abundant protein LEA-2 subgroup domain-containing protein n=1 Tax=Liquidambar formosana TaxID=63359 RepID=A0AAP0WYT7_LIQFO